MLIAEHKTKAPLLALLVAGLLAGCYWIVARSCQFDHLAVLSYGLYVLVCVWLPGHGLMVGLRRERVTLACSLALGIPLGFGLEITSYLGLCMVDLRQWHGWGAAATGLLLVGLAAKRRSWRAVIPGFGHIGSWPAVLLAAAALMLMITTAARMYAPSPLAEGMLLHATHHDWVYLISRAAEIKHHWPLEDPSLAGTTMSYHYFLMLHVAAVSNAFGSELSLVLLRLVPITMGAVLLLQTYVLARTVSHSRWGGVLAVWLLFATGEVSWLMSTGGGLFQNLFIKWLFISPTFYFGMIFTGALLIWMHRLLTTEQPSAVDYGVLLFLSLIGTGAKGTTVGPLVVATGFLMFWQWWRHRSWSWRLPIIGILMTTGFMLAYAIVLRQWSGQGTVFALWAFPSVSAFWLAYAGPWQHFLHALGLPTGWSRGLAHFGCALTIFAGVNGVLVLGLAFPWMRESRGKENEAYAWWLGFVVVACALFGHLLYLDSHGETYLYFPIRLPLAVLTAAGGVALARRWQQRYRYAPDMLARNFRILGVLLTLGAASGLITTGLLSPWIGIGGAAVILMLLAPGQPRQGTAPLGMEFGRFMLRLSPALVLVSVLALQGFNLLLANDSGLRLWQVAGASGRDESTAELNEGMRWLREHTPTDAIVYATSYMGIAPEALNSVVIDNTTLDKYYYYSALGERRLYVEGPAYARDQALAGQRLKNLHRIPADPSPACYLLVDRAGNIPAGVIPSDTPALFSNARVAIYPLHMAVE